MTLPAMKVPIFMCLTKSDERIKAIITNGVKGEMPSFKKKLGDADLAALAGFLRNLK
jgi:mono/diheme cytochrome c family protein